MNIQELKEWLKDAKYVDEVDFNVDGCDNRWARKIFKKDDKLYSLGYCNNSPTPKLGELGYESERDKNGVRIKDKNGEDIFIYKPTLVKAVKKQVTITEYEEISTTQ